MAKLKLTLCCGVNDLNRGLIDGSVTPEGIDLTVLPLPAPERHRRMSDDLEFDICEYSLASYVTARDRGTLPVAAIPAFPLRKMRHASIYINTGRGISGPADLHGRRVGLLSYQTTAGVWARGILLDQYGVDLKGITWVTADRDEVPFDIPGGYRVEHCPDADLDRMLVAGELDACVTPALLPSMVSGDPRAGRLWADCKQEEQAWWRQTGIIPIMHTVVIKQSVLDQHPWVALSMLKAFQQSKQQCLYRYQHDTLALVGLCWFRELWEEQVALMGPDPFPYDFAGARPAVDAFCRYAHTLGLTRRPVAPEALFFKAAMKPLPRHAGGSFI